MILAAELTIRLQDLPAEIALGESSILLPPNSEAPFLILPYVQAKERAQAFFHQRYLSGMLLKTSGNIARAARLSHLDRSNFRRLLKRLPHDLRKARTVFLHHLAHVVHAGHFNIVAAQ